MKRILYILICGMFVSCNSNEKKTYTEYFPSGLWKVCEITNDSLLNGKCIQFYKDSTVESISNWQKGKRHGVSIYNDTLGNIQQKEFFNNGLLTKATLYPNFKDSILVDIWNINNIIYTNQVIYYKNGKILKENSFYIEINSLDTIKYGDDLVLDITLLAPYDDYSAMDVLICNFDNEMNTTDTLCDIYDESHDFNIKYYVNKSNIKSNLEYNNQDYIEEYNILNYKEGKNTIYGYVKNWGLWISDSLLAKGDSINGYIFKNKKIFFKKEFIVLP